jgi:hypothetical protein
LIAAMVRRGCRRRWARPWRLAATFVLAALGAAPGCGRRAAEAPRAAPRPAVSQGLRAYRDPSTGAFVEPPPGTTTAAPAARLVAPSTLTEEAAPGGGRMVRLNGAFRSQLVGRRDANGDTTVSCATTAGAPGAAIAGSPVSAP